MRIVRSELQCGHPGAGAPDPVILDPHVFTKIHGDIGMPVLWADPKKCPRMFLVEFD